MWYFFLERKNRKWTSFLVLFSFLSPQKRRRYSPIRSLSIKKNERLGGRKMGGGGQGSKRVQGEHRGRRRRELVAQGKGGEESARFWACSFAAPSFRMEGKEVARAFFAADAAISTWTGDCEGGRKGRKPLTYRPSLHQMRSRRLRPLVAAAAAVAAGFACCCCCCCCEAGGVEAAGGAFPPLTGEARGLSSDAGGGGSSSGAGET